MVLLPTTNGDHMPWVFAADCDIGGRDEQQDRIAVLHAAGGAVTGQAGDPDTHLLVVADGAGGHGDGALAAQTVIDSIQRHFSSGVTGDPLKYVEDICVVAHLAVTGLTAQAGLPPASTCVVLLLRNREAYWAHVGDSRIYHLRNGQVLFQSADHSIRRHIRDSITDGNPDSTDLPPANILYMCLGGDSEVCPESNASLVVPGDTFLLCSDGFWNQVCIEEVAESWCGKESDLYSVTEWVRQASLRGGGEADNISLVCARLLPDSRRRLFGKSGRLATWFRKLLSS